jgi:hypothetical protein
VQDDRQSSDETEARQRSASNGGATDGEQVVTTALDTTATATDSDESSGRLDSVTARAGDVGRRLKPVAAAAAIQTAHAAETAASYGVHLSALGLQRVDDFLKERRERRRATSGESAANEATPSPLDPSVIAHSVDDHATTSA